MKRNWLIVLVAVVLMGFVLAGCEDAAPVLAGTPTPAATPTKTEISVPLTALAKTSRPSRSALR